MKKNTKALITGGAGFIGFHLASHLARQGYSVTILDNFERGRKDVDFENLISRKNVNFVKGDVTLQSTFDKLENYDQIYHLAAINGTGNFYDIPDKVLKVGVLGIINVLEWFANQKNGKLLFSSSSETYSSASKLLGDKFPLPTPEDVPLAIDDPKNVRWSYAASKLLGEVAVYSYAKARKFNDFVIIRYHNIYGPRMGYEHVVPQFIERIEKKENPFKIYGGSESRAFCYIHDAVRATQFVMECRQSNSQIVHIGRSDWEISITELAKKLFGIAKVSPKIEIMPAPVGSVKRRCPDVTKLERWGFKPEISLHDGLKKTYEWYKGKF